jgi:hypothetical protein
MGRRAKNKQGDPVPFAEVNGVVGSGRPSAKKLGKRKAEFDDDGGKDSAPSKRPQKKVKESESGKGKGREKDANGKKGTSLKAVKSSAALGKKKRKEAAVEKDESGGSEGWEDVEDDEDLKTQTKQVFRPPYNDPVTKSSYYSTTGLCFTIAMIATKTALQDMTETLQIMIWKLLRMKSMCSTLIAVEEYH